MNFSPKTQLLPILAMLAVLLTACGRPPDQTTLTDVAQAAARQDDRVTVEQLAGWLIEARGDFVLIDVRSEGDYEKGAIGEAKNISITELVTRDVFESLPRDRKIILYSNGSENAAKAEVMLRLAGFDAQLLAGGYNAWHRRILNPDISADELDGESLQVSAQRAYSCYFVGERSDSAKTRKSRSSEPFVPPVYTEVEEQSDLPPPPPEEGC
jgi:rhodanese-related sulfurtransferase